MKKGYLIVIISLITFCVGAQSKLHVGLRFNPVLSYLKPEQLDSPATPPAKLANLGTNGGLIGYTWGPMLDYYFNDNLAGNLELLISNVGGKYGYEWFQQQIGITHQYAVKYKVQYLQFPATIKMVTNEIGYMKYYLNFGVAPSFKLAVKRSSIDKDLATMKEISNFQDIKKPEDINFFNCHVVVGGGLMYSLSDNTSALIGLSYQNGFVHANATGINSTLPNWYALRNRYLSLNLGIVF